MAGTSHIRATLFAKDLIRMADFYSGALGMTRGAYDHHHAVLKQLDFELVVHQIPHRIAAEIEISEPPARREDGVLRLEFSVADINGSRIAAKSLGGDIDEAPPAWAEPGTNFFLGNDPEGNVFGVSGRVSRAPDVED